ncbi:MAG: hypothetical protein EPN22_07855 [Nitrospirae bacterium]|nr:MAG: hypothetical protein EPN22_07855 [Nitrospirota bacterium]
MGRSKLPLFVVIAVLLITSFAHAWQGGLNVSVFPAPPSLSASVEFSEPSGNKKLDADETGRLIITVRNTGKGEAFDVKADLSTERNIRGLDFDGSVTIGTIAPGESVRKEVALRASEDIATTNINFNITLKEANGFDPDPVRIAFETKAFEPPKLILADIGMDKPRVKPGETVEVTLRIQNTGYGDARNVSVDIETGENVFIAGDSKTHFELGGLSAGKFRDVKFEFYTNKRIRNGEKVPVSVRINEARPQFKLAKALDIVMDSPQKQIETVVVKGDEDRPKGSIEVAGGLSSEVDSNIPEGIKAGEYDVAVIIGNKDYTEAGIANVEYADRDAQIMKQYLMTAFGFDEDRIIYAENARIGKFNEIFGSEAQPRGRLNKAVKPGVSKVFVYYVGHGAPDLDTKEAYFVPVDANPQYLASNGYKLQTFYNNLSQIPAKKMTIVLDACFSGNSQQKQLIFDKISPALVKVKKELRSPQNALLITSAAPDQVSAWFPKKKHSLFTYYFLKGIQGGADANKDRKITAAEMRDYLKEHVPYEANQIIGFEQQPLVMGNDSDVIVTLKK